MQLYNDDCLNIMRLMADKSVDLIITDPPYGIGEAKKNNNSRSCLAEAKEYTRMDWDNSAPSAEYFSEIMRVSKHQVIFGANHFVEHLRNSSCWIVWDKDNGENDFADCELAWCSFSSAVRRFKFRWQGMLQQDMKNKETRIHPTQKPVRLFEWILEKYAEPGWKIMDPFLGSGSTAIAAERLGFDFIGVEREQSYFEAALDRIPRETAQQKLF